MPDRPPDDLNALAAIDRFGRMVLEQRGGHKPGKTVDAQAPGLDKKSVTAEGGGAPRKRFKHGLEVDQGRQVVKGYSVTEDQLVNIAGVGWLAALCFSGATGLFGFSLNLWVTLDLSSNLSAERGAWWRGMNLACFAGGSVLFILASVFATYRLIKLTSIKKKTKFKSG